MTPIDTALTASFLIGTVWAVGFLLMSTKLEENLKRLGCTEPEYMQAMRKRAAMWCIPSKLYFRKEYRMRSVIEENRASMEETV